MQVLFDLIHSLSKDEKRLYHQHRRDNRGVHIYEGYLRAARYEKSLDQDIYRERFAEVSRAFYSMAKRSLLDDISNVLLEHGNSQHPDYMYTRLCARAGVLLARGMGPAAGVYATEAREVAAQAGSAERELKAIELQLEALYRSADASLEQYEALERMAERLGAQDEKRRRLAATARALALLRRQAAGAPTPEQLAKAELLMQQLTALDLAPQELGLHLARLDAERDYFALRALPDDYHRRYLKFYNEASKLPPDQLSERRRYDLLARLLASGLRAGDFLLLSGIFYRMEKEVPALREELRPHFLPAYYETAALFHFYENDIPTALREIDAVLRAEGLPREQLVRCAFYKLSMILAAHLGLQAKDEMRRLAKRLPELAEHPLFWLFEVLFMIDTHAASDDVGITIERHRVALRRRGAGSAAERDTLEALAACAAYAERRRLRPRPLVVTEPEWEPIVRVDLWLRAKQENKFYYNLLVEPWQARRKVY